MITTTPRARTRDVKYLTVEPGRISLHGVALTDSEYAMLRGIAERMKRADTIRESMADLIQAHKGSMEC